MLQCVWAKCECGVCVLVNCRLAIAFKLEVEVMVLIIGRVGDKSQVVMAMSICVHF